MARDTSLIRHAYNMGKADARDELSLSEEEVDKLVGSEYRKDYMRALADHEHLQKIMGRGRWVQTNDL